MESRTSGTAPPRGSSLSASNLHSQPSPSLESLLTSSPWDKGLSGSCIDGRAGVYPAVVLNMQVIPSDLAHATRQNQGGDGAMQLPGLTMLKQYQSVANVNIWYAAFAIYSCTVHEVQHPAVQMQLCNQNSRWQPNMLSCY